jgi:transcriptional regulator GlxA family with amidase domain
MFSNRLMLNFIALTHHKKKLDFQIQEVLRLMENNINEPLTIAEIAQHVNVQQ